MRVVWRFPVAAERFISYIGNVEYDISFHAKHPLRYEVFFQFRVPNGTPDLNLKEAALMNESSDRGRILEAAARRFMELGISKVTLDEIASDLGMSKKTMYKYFPSKEDLLKNIIHERIKRNGKRFNDIMGSSSPFGEKLQEIFTFVGREFSTPSKQFILDLRRLAPDLWEEADEFRRTTIVTNVRSMIEKGKEEGMIRKDLDSDLFVLVFLNAVQNIVNPQTLSEYPFTALQAFRGILRIIFEGALTEKASATLRISEQFPPEPSFERQH
jgi:AcrR family transcriptional regulator